MSIIDRTFSSLDEMAKAKYSSFAAIILKFGSCGWKANNYEKYLLSNKYKVVMQDKNDEII
jgi:hypothetical protein